MAARTELSSSNMVTTSTRMCGLSCTMRRVASMPFRSGICRSMEHQVRLERAGESNSLFAGRCLTHQFGIRHRGKQCPQPITKDEMVIGDQHAQGVCHSPSTVTNG